MKGNSSVKQRHMFWISSTESYFTWVIHLQTVLSASIGIIGLSRTPVCVVQMAPISPHPVTLLKQNFIGSKLQSTWYTDTAAGTKYLLCIRASDPCLFVAVTDSHYQPLNHVVLLYVMNWSQGRLHGPALLLQRLKTKSRETQSRCTEAVKELN